MFRKVLDDLRNKALGGSSAKAVAKHHEAGKLTARERLELLFDEGTFMEYDQFVEHRYLNHSSPCSDLVDDAYLTHPGYLH